MGQQVNWLSELFLRKKCAWLLICYVQFCLFQSLDIGTALFNDCLNISPFSSSKTKETNKQPFFKNSMIFVVKKENCCFSIQHCFQQNKLLNEKDSVLDFTAWKSLSTNLNLFRKTPKIRDNRLLTMVALNLSHHGFNGCAENVAPNLWKQVLNPLLLKPMMILCWFIYLKEKVLFLYKMLLTLQGPQLRHRQPICQRTTQFKIPNSFLKIP